MCLFIVRLLVHVFTLFHPEKMLTRAEKVLKTHTKSSTVILNSHHLSIPSELHHPWVFLKDFTQFKREMSC